MKLTVKLRVVGGFSIITLLLLFIGLTAYTQLSSISESTAEVNTISIPALENSALMKSEFVLMSKISLQAFNAQEQSQIAALRQQFNTEQQAYQTAANQLNTAVQQQPTLLSAAQQVNLAYDAFIPLSNQLFEQLEQNLRSQNEIDDKLSELEMTADDMAALLLDFTDIGNVRNRFPQAYQAATQMETGINSLLSVVVDLNRTSNDSTATTISNDIAFRLQDLTTQLAVMLREASQVPMPADLEEKLATLTSLLDASQGIPGTKATLLAGKARANQLLLQADEQTALALTRLDALLNQSTQVATTIQNESQNSVSTAVTC
jgi:methyl-accepting chemotaxis protein